MQRWSPSPVDVCDVCSAVMLLLLWISLGWIKRERFVVFLRCSLFLPKPSAALVQQNTANPHWGEARMYGFLNPGASLWGFGAASLPAFLIPAFRRRWDWGHPWGCGSGGRALGGSLSLIPRCFWGCSVTSLGLGLTAWTRGWRVSGGVRDLALQAGTKTKMRFKWGNSDPSPVSGDLPSVDSGITK